MRPSTPAEPHGCPWLAHVTSSMCNAAQRPPGNPLWQAPGAAVAVTTCGRKVCAGLTLSDCRRVT